jgi:hypothetical protein
MKKLVLETTAPFQGLPELVAYDEGLFEKEGRCRPTSPPAAPTAWSITPSTSSITTASIHRHVNQSRPGRLAASLWDLKISCEQLFLISARYHVSQGKS